MYAARHFSTITHPRQPSSSQSHGNTIAHCDSSSHVIPERSQYPTINSSFGIFIRLFPFPAIRRYPPPLFAGEKFRDVSQLRLFTTALFLIDDMLHSKNINIMTELPGTDHSAVHPDEQFSITASPGYLLYNLQCRLQIVGVVDVLHSNYNITSCIILHIISFQPLGFTENVSASGIAHVRVNVYIIPPHGGRQDALRDGVEPSVTRSPSGAWAAQLHPLSCFPCHYLSF